MNTQKEIYKRLIRVIPNLYSIKESGKSEVSGFMDFNLDILQRKGDVLRIAISHYYKHPSGDMIADPDMEILINRKTETAEALTYQDTYGYQEVYAEDGSCNQSLQHSLNRVTGNSLAHRLPCESGRVTTERSAVVTRPESDSKCQMSGNFLAPYLRALWITA